jgi:hypothetical protein
VLAALAATLSLVLAPVEDEIARALHESPAGGRRAAAATRPLVGAPYQPSPLGEERGRDPDPRFRLDAFDCMTFIETAVALGSASSLAEARAAIDDVRYVARPDFADRNHEVLSQWIPSNARKGWIVDVTAALAGDEARPAAKEYTPASWQTVRTAGRSIPGVPRARLPLGRFDARIVPPDATAAIAPRLPPGAVVFVFREDQPERATRVTHAGLVVHGPRGAVRVRHATSSKGVGRVIEEPLDRFVRRQAKAWPRWPLAGFAFYALPDMSARAHALAVHPVPVPPPRP